MAVEPHALTDHTDVEAPAPNVGQVITFGASGFYEPADVPADKISDLGQIIGADIAVDDLFVVVDFDADETKAIRADELRSAIGSAKPIVVEFEGVEQIDALEIIGVENDDNAIFRVEPQNELRVDVARPWPVAEVALLANNSSLLEGNPASAFDAAGSAAVVQSNLDAHAGTASIHYADASATGGPYGRQGNAWVEVAAASHSHAVFSSGVAGFVPDPGPATGRFLKDDGTWAVVSGGGGGIGGTIAADQIAFGTAPDTIGGNAGFTFDGIKLDVFGASLDADSLTFSGAATIASQVGALTLSPATSTTTDKPIVSTLADGSAPFEVTSTTVVGNLNADLLDGQHASAFDAVGSAALVQSNLDVHAGTASIHFADASATGGPYGRQGNAWVEVDAAGSAAVVQSNLDAHAGTASIHFADASATGGPYGRQGNAWVEVAAASHSHAVFSSGVAGFVPDPGASSGRFLKDDGTWAVVSGGGGGIGGTIATNQVAFGTAPDTIGGDTWLVVNPPLKRLQPENVVTGKTHCFATEFAASGNQVNWIDSQNQSLTLTGNVALNLNLSGLAGPCRLLLRVIQDATGGHVLTFNSPGNIAWRGGVVPTNTPDPDAEDIYVFYWSGSRLYGEAGLNYF